MANVECAVRPPSNNREAIPDEATITIICPQDYDIFVQWCCTKRLSCAGTPIRKEGSSFISKYRANNGIISIVLVNVEATDISLCIYLLGLDLKLSMFQNQFVTNNCAPIFDRLRHRWDS
ncbi:hypothetical protein RHMOL_Rhmol11G0034600 [Rhododendron molle]|uniref:Uncharacterized protein n=1 Tax=Rhododendron molle TaxID=49168 RepID=A0ACC0LPS4_RHOML|nr:hypothetical protein RHMOL_Rhmol11G0034600 [Rhododendron molle]